MPPPPPPRRDNDGNWVAVSVCITIEAPRPLVYALFSDLESMSEWSSTLAAVSRSDDEPELSEWSFRWQGISLSWRARDTAIVENELVAWESLSGLANRGAVTFRDWRDAGDGTVTVGEEKTTTTTTTKDEEEEEEEEEGDDDSGGGGEAEKTVLTMTLEYDVKSRLAAGLMRTPFVSNFVERAMRTDLNRFREYCLRQRVMERRRRQQQQRREQPWPRR